ncbi:hypothetical protein D3H65_23720 [Paraflavitalea soli]|uniref:Uncharacterized protein n=1 Tax=Paraflavitalea soli TaxID=2315862 RepID=A0A3B7MRN5_9BACT|nr:DUF6266 family protein [Paraflavitalea soli]AXY76818.1 hypothetical protein D3H65_23720 [Paraflavitalea soli]
MGRLINGINGPIQGKVGAVIGSNWKGIPYVKGPYKERTTNVSKKEKANRGKFAMAQFWLKPLLPFVREGFKGYSATSEGFVAAKSWLLLHAFEGVAPAITINPALVKLSHGDLPLSDGIAVEKTAPGVLLFTWDTAPVEGGSSYDQVMLLAYDIDHTVAYYITTGQFRSTGTDVLNIPITKGRTWHLYLAFTAADRSMQSHSVYLGAINS